MCPVVSLVSFVSRVCDLLVILLMLIYDSLTLVALREGHLAIKIRLLFGVELQCYAASRSDALQHTK